MVETFGELFEGTYGGMPPLAGSVLKGKVVLIESGCVHVNVGIKLEGRIPISQFYGEDVKVGDSVDVYLRKLENSYHECVLSRAMARREEAWGELEELHKSGTPVRASLLRPTRGGFVMDALGATVFLPSDQTHMTHDDCAEGMQQECFVMKMDREKGTILLSQRSDGTAFRSHRTPAEPLDIEKGQVVEGVVKNITNYGAFLRIGNGSALLYVKDISWSPVKHPGDVLRVGQELTVKVIRVEQEGRRIGVSLKALEKSPWDRAQKEFPEGKKVKGVVTNITSYGFFVQLEGFPVEGLVHISEMSWTGNVEDPSSLVKQGQEVEVLVIQVDPERERINLSLKQVQENPWRKVVESYKEGQEVEGVVARLTRNGPLVRLEDGMESLLHGTNGEYAVGDSVSAVVLSIDQEHGKMSLCSKDQQSRGAVMAKRLRRGAAFTCTITGVMDTGLQVELENGVHGFIRRSHLAQDKSEQRPGMFAVGNKVDALFLGTSEGNESIPQFSIRAFELESQRKAIKKYGSLESGSRLSNVLGGAIEMATSREKADGHDDDSGSKKDEE